MTCAVIPLELSKPTMLFIWHNVETIKNINEGIGLHLACWKDVLSFQIGWWWAALAVFQYEFRLVHEIWFHEKSQICYHLPIWHFLCVRGYNVNVVHFIMRCQYFQQIFSVKYGKALAVNTKIWFYFLKKKELIGFELTAAFFFFCFTTPPPPPPASFVDSSSTEEESSRLALFDDDDAVVVVGLGFIVCVKTRSSSSSEYSSHTSISLVPK